MAVFPHNPEQWIYAKAAEYEKVMPKLPQHKLIFTTPEDIAIAKLEMEIHCLKIAIKDFNTLYNKFKENPQNAE